MPLPKNVEILKNMNSTNGKFATWNVRVLEPKIIEYEFSSKGGLKNYTGQNQKDVQEEEEPAPGSASTEPRRKRTSNDAPAEEGKEEEGKRRAGGGGAKLC